MTAAQKIERHDRKIEDCIGVLHELMERKAAFTAHRPEDLGVVIRQIQAEARKLQRLTAGL